MPAILSEKLRYGGHFFMRKNLKGSMIVLLVFILSVIGKYGSYLQSEDVFSTQIQRQNKKVYPRRRRIQRFMRQVFRSVFM